MNTYPEHDKLRAVSNKSQSIGEFLDWARNEHGWELCRMEPYGDYTPIYKSINDILAEYFEIDRTKLDDEKRAMLEELKGQA